MRDLLVNIRYWIYIHSYFLQYLVLLVIFNYSAHWTMDYMDVSHFQKGSDNPLTVFLLPMIGLLIFNMLVWLFIRCHAKDTVRYDTEGVNGFLMIVSSVAYIAYKCSTISCRCESAFIFITATILSLICLIAYSSMELSD